MDRPRRQLLLLLALGAGAAGALPALAAQDAGAGAAAQAPRTATVVAHSVEHRPIRLVRLGAPAATHRILVVGCIHGTETAGVAVTRALRRVTPPAGSQLLLLDALNPDGRAHGTRGNARGVDLNRNFPSGWRRLTGIFASGPKPASEPETRAAMQIISTERPRVTIWFHQHMDLVDQTRGADPAVVRRYATVARMRVRQLAPLPGTASRWQNHRFGATSAFVVELPAGRLSPAALRRQVAAVMAVARWASVRQ